jgi:hypothetical protein
MNTNDNSFNTDNSLDILLNEQESLTDYLDRLQQAISLLQGDSGGVTGGVRPKRNISSQNRTNRNMSNTNRSSSSDQNEDMSIDDIDPNNIRWHNNGESVDLRTMEGRTLLAEGLVDDQGFPLDDFPQNFYPSNRSNRGRGSGRSVNRSSR